MKQLALICCIPVFGYAQSKTEYSWNNLPKIAQPVFKKDTVSIVKYGAVGDGVVLNTASINKAIAECSRKGGGVVLVPGGIWLTGPIEMKSNVNLHVSRTAVLLFTGDKTQYALVDGYYEGKYSARNQSPIWAKNQENIAITGSGVIDGNGDVWRALHKGQVTESFWKRKIASGGVLSADGKKWYPSEQFKKASEGGRSMLLEGGKKLEEFEDMKDFLRPNLLVFNNCKKVLLEGVTFQNSGAWCLHPLMSQDVTLRNLIIRNPEYSHNGDGVDVESCRNFLIEGCTFDVGDDAICIKSGKDEEGRKRGMPCENGIVRNNVVYKGHGGFVVGSEMSGGARNIFVYDCTFIGTDKGLRFKSTRGRGGVVEKIYAKNIFMKDIEQEAIFFDLYYLLKFATDGVRKVDSTFSEATPVFRDMQFEDIICVGAKKGIFIRGLPESPIENIRLKNMVLTTDIGAEMKDAKNITLTGIKLNSEKKPEISVVSSTGITVDGKSYDKK